MEERQLPHTSFCSIPNQDGRTAILARGWVCAIVTKDRDEHRAAAEFLEWILLPRNLAEWAATSHHLPAFRSAINALQMPPTYIAFLRG